MPEAAVVRAWAWRTATETAKERAVLAYLAHVFDESTGRSVASYTQMSRATGLHAKSCHRAVKLLAEAGTLRVERWLADGRWNLINRYAFPPLDGTKAGFVTLGADPMESVYEAVVDRMHVAVPM